MFVRYLLRTALFAYGMGVRHMTHEEKLGIAADVTDYIILCSYDGYPYVTQQNGDVTYTEEAQELFNDHFDVVFSMIEDNKEPA